MPGAGWSTDVALKGRYAASVKKAEAIIKPFKLDAVKDALRKLGVIGMTVSEVRGCGRWPGDPEVVRGPEIVVPFVAKLKLETLCADAQAPRIVHRIETTAAAGELGDGTIVGVDVPQVTGIRAGETGPEAV